MYDWPEQQAANDRLWALLAAEFAGYGIKADPVLRRQGDYGNLWLSPKMLVSQTCGLPLVTTLRGQVTSFAAPVYDVAGAGKGTYSSAVLVRKHDPAQTLVETAGYRFGFNAKNSQSGYACMRGRAFRQDPEDGHFSAGIKTGAHRTSMRLLAEGQVDVIAVDCVCWDLAQQHDPKITARLRVLDWTPPGPAMPFIMNPHCGLTAEQMFAVFHKTVTEKAAPQTLKQLRLKTLIPCDDRFFQPLADRDQGQGEAYRLYEGEDS